MSEAENKLREELERLKRRVGMGYEVEVLLVYFAENVNFSLFSLWAKF